MFSPGIVKRNAKTKRPSQKTGEKFSDAGQVFVFSRIQIREKKRASGHAARPPREKTRGSSAEEKVV